jgi:threonylcarbamoyladenosine tRNA methylthiotransferase MtaB
VATFYVSNFGCRATQSDGAAIERQLQERGLERAQAPTEAGIVVLNTCTVTAAADQEARAAIRRFHRKNPQAQIVVTGCYAQRAPEEVAALPGVTKVVGNSHKHRLAEIALPLPNVAASVPVRAIPGADREGTTAFIPLSTLTSIDQRPTANDQRPVFVSDIFAHTELQAAPVFDAANERTRPNLKVQDGCNNRCSFCVIPYVRGHSRSLRLTEVIREVDALVTAGYREVVISGINLGRWGRDLPAWASIGTTEGAPLLGVGQRPTMNDQRLRYEQRPRFQDLIHAILRETALEKLRISSVEPMDWTDELIRLLATSPRIAKHAHVPMQSGSDAVLRRMHRKYRPWHYRQKIENIRAAMPTAAIGADVMVGFPGETEAEFEETHRMVEDLPFTYLHVFTYSARPGTPAASMGKQVPAAVAHERNRILRDIAARKKLAFMQTFVGRPVEAITLNRSGRDPDGEYTEALTDNYLQLRLKGTLPSNRWIPAKVEKVLNGMLVGVASLIT